METNTQNVFTPGTPDLVEELNVPEGVSFQTAQERDQPSLNPEMIEPELPEVEDFVDLGAPFALEDLPDRGSYKEVLVEFPACMPFSSFGESISDTGFDRSEKIFALAGRHRQALQLGEIALRRPIYSSYGKIVSRKERRSFFKEEMDILRELLTNLYYFNNGTDNVGFALQKIILINLNQQLKIRRNEAKEDLISSGEGIPSLPRWGLNGKADEFWTANDFEILGACYRREVENFLAYLAEHHDFTKSKGNRKPDQRSITPVTPHKKSVIRPPTITAIRDYQPTFIEGEPDSISVHLKKSRARFSQPSANMNTSVFGHPVQNNSSHAFRELFGVKESKDVTTPYAPATNFETGSGRESRGDDNRSDASRSHKSDNNMQQIRPRGGGDPGDSDGDDSDDGGGNNGPHRGPQKPSSPNNP